MSRTLFSANRVAWSERIRSATPLIVLAILWIAITAAAPGFTTTQTLSVILADAAVTFVLGAGVTFVILLGGIDLSLQAVASLASVLFAQLLPIAGAMAFPATLLLGIVFGTVSGLVHVRLKVPSFIATLATGSVAAGLALLLSAGRTITIQAQGRAHIGWVNGSVAGIPDVLLLSVVIGIAGALVLRYTRFGRYSLAVGAGEPAALAAGINVDRVKVMAFTMSGTWSAIAGIILASRMSSGSPSLASQLLLPAIAAVIVGGTAITGGLGGLGRTAVGALIVSVVQVGMTFVSINIFAQQAVFGLVLVGAVAMTIDRSKIPVIK